jgi:predicted phage terminase large subunit-like protein
VCFDELTRFPEEQYRFLFSRLRRLKGADVPVRMRAATNPGGKYGEWVRKRFVADAYLRERCDTRFSRTWWKDGRLFVPARLEDNPSLDADDYELSLAELLPVVRAQLRSGDWGAHEGGHFQKAWFRSYRDHGDAYHVPHTGEVARKDCCQVLVAVDPAGGVSEHADYCAMVCVALTPGGSLLVIEVVRERMAVEHHVPRLQELCLRRRPHFVVMEDAFAQSAYIRQARGTPGIPTVHGISPGGQSKLVRATPAILRAEQGGLCLPESAWWLEDFVSELCSFTGVEEMDASDDQTDSLAYCVLAIDRFHMGGSAGDGPVIFGRPRR